MFYKDRIGDGELNASVTANITETKVVGPIKVPTALIGQEDVLFSREDIARVESAQPTFKVNSLLRYKFGNYQLQLGNTYFGDVTYLHPDDGDPSNWVLNTFTNRVETRDQRFAPKILTDLGLSYQLNDNVIVSVYGNNIFNVFPDKHTHSANTSQGNFTYSRRVNQFGVNGSNFILKLLLRL